jgi:hypothetical protein
MLHRITGEQASFTPAEGRIGIMSDRDQTDWHQTDRDQTDRHQTDRDHWEMFAESMDLTIEGHRLIAQEIIYEARLLWRWTLSWLRDLIDTSTRRHPSPPT